MGHKVDLSKFNIRCDLISDKIVDNSDLDIKIDEKSYKDIKVQKVYVDDDYESFFNKRKGRYITIYFDDVTDFNNRCDVIKVLSEELKSILNDNKLLNKKVLIIGLGNSKSTPDCLGPKTLNNIIVTRHLFELNEECSSYCNVSCFAPGVYANTGIESYDVISGIVFKTNPDYLIVIDSLASSSIENINKVIQITDSGIEPGSGVGNNRKEISFDTLKIPVIAIGIPTVVDAATIVNDTFKFLMKKISYNILNIDNDKEKLLNPDCVNYLNSGFNLDEEEKKKFFGLIGELNDKEMFELMKEVLSPIGYNFMVTPKEVDFVIEKLSFVIAKAINSVLHEDIYD